MAAYIALIHKDANSDFGVSFPDLPGCVTAGSTIDEARSMAREALALHLEGMAEERLSIPAPSSLEEIMAEAANREAVAVLVDAPASAPKSVRVNISLPEDTLERIDAHAESQGLTRSGFLARAAERELEAA